MKFLYMFLLAFLSFSCMAGPLNTAPLGGKIDCTDISASYQLDECVHKEMIESSRLLSKALVKFGGRTKRVYAADPNLGNELIALVHETQDAWVIFRDKNCKIEAFQIEKDMPAYVTTVNSCVSQMNVKRARELKQL